MQCGFTVRTRARNTILLTAAVALRACRWEAEDGEQRQGVRFFSNRFAVLFVLRFQGVWGFEIWKHARGYGTDIL
jgi:hypothetical protein